MTEPTEPTRPSGLTRPLALGYLRAHVLMTDVELDEAKARIALHARMAGYQLSSIFVEQLPTAPAAYRALLDAVRWQNATAVIVPSMLHFSPIGDPAAMRRRLEQETGARVLIASPQQPPSPPGEGFS